MNNLFKNLCYGPLAPRDKLAAALGVTRRNAMKILMKQCTCHSKAESTKRSVERLAYSRTELAEALGLSLSTIRRMIKEGRIPVTYIGRRALILKAELDKYLSECTKQP